MSKSSASSKRLTRTCKSKRFAVQAASVRLSFTSALSFGSMQPSVADKLRELEFESNKHKKLLAEANLEIHALKRELSVKR
jgi:hypothetical protein